ITIIAFFLYLAEDGIRDFHVTGVQTCALPICPSGDSLFVRTLCHVCLRAAARVCGACACLTRPTAPLCNTAECVKSPAGAAPCPRRFPAPPLTPTSRCGCACTMSTGGTRVSRRCCWSTAVATIAVTGIGSRRRC